MHKTIEHQIFDSKYKQYHSRPFIPSLHPQRSPYTPSHFSSYSLTASRYRFTSSLARALAYSYILSLVALHCIPFVPSLRMAVFVHAYTPINKQHFNCAVINPPLFRRVKIRCYVTNQKLGSKGVYE